MTNGSEGMGAVLIQAHELSYIFEWARPDEDAMCYID